MFIARSAATDWEQRTLLLNVPICYTQKLLQAGVGG